MRFLFTLAYYEWTGPAEPMAALARHLIERGHEVTIWIEGKRDGDLAERLEALGLPYEKPLALSRKSGPIAIAKDIAKAGELLRGRFDAAICHMSADQMIIGQSKRLHGVPVFRAIQGLGSHTTRPGRGLLMRSADGLIVPSADHADSASTLYGFAQERIATLSGAVDLDAFQPGGDDALRQRMGLSDQDLLLISVSRQKPERRQMALIEALAVARRKRSDLHMAFIGRGEFQDELREAVHQRGLEEAVRFDGYARGDDLVRAYQACDASVWLAEGNDGTCRAVGQSLACGRPVIGARLGAIRDALEGHPQAGWLVAPKQLDELASCLIELPSRAELRGHEAACRALAEASWSEAARCDRFLSIVESWIE